MNIVEPYAKIWSIDGREPTRLVGQSILERIEYFGRISHRSEDSQTPTSWERFIPAVVMDRGDWSIVEHLSATVDMVVDRGITHELVRHRLFSFTQESTRFVNYEKKMPASFIKPDLRLYPAVPEHYWDNVISGLEESYMQLIRWGCPPQIARSILPNALASRIIMTGNLRNWRHFLLMRTTKESHPQMRQVTIPLLAEFKSVVPILFDDIEPNARQIDNMRKPQ